MTLRNLLYILILTCLSSKVYSQKKLYGVDFDKAYPEIKSEGTKNISKKVILTDKSVFYSVRISTHEFVFSTVHRGFGPFKNPSNYYSKGLLDIKKVFGDPINIYTDTSFTTATNDFYIWKVKRDTGYFLIYYGLRSLGLSLNVQKMYNEEITNQHIRSDIYSEQQYRNKSYYIKVKELNMPDWH